MDTHHIHLTSAELASLWSIYMSDSLAYRMISHFVATVKDPEIRPLLEWSNSMIVQRQERVRAFFSRENVAIPQGFADGDVNLKAPRLYADTYYLFYISGMANLGMGAFSRALSMASRQDVRTFISDCVNHAVEKFNRATDLLLQKGIYTRPPFIPVPTKISFADEETFLSNVLKKKRPLNVLEISSLWSNIMTNTLGKALLLGFTQVAKDQELKELLFRGSRISNKHIQLFGRTLLEEDIPAPSTWDSSVSGSTEAPYSDRMMAFHTLELISTGLGNYGMAMAQNARRDLSLTYSRLMAEVGQYADDMSQFMAKKGWLEQPPLAKNHKQLAGMD